MECLGTQLKINNNSLLEVIFQFAIEGLDPDL